MSTNVLLLGYGILQHFRSHCRFGAIEDIESGSRNAIYGQKVFENPHIAGPNERWTKSGKLGQGRGLQSVARRLEDTVEIRKQDRKL